MKILQVVDVPNWALGQLARVIETKNPHLWIRTIYIHPKDLRNQPDFWISSFKNEVDTFQPDIVHFHYWDVANTLAPHVPAGTKKMLTHHNQRSLTAFDWKGFDALVVHTKKAKAELEAAGHTNVNIIQHGIDIDRFQFNESYNPENRMIGYVGRIVPWKGLVEILQSAKNLGTKVIAMGRIDKADYWEKVEPYRVQLDERFATPDEKQADVYHEMSVYVGNSDDHVEEGPLGLIEAMACGIPVITTRAGEAADIIKDRENGILIEFNNQQNIESALRIFFAMPQEQKEEMREAGWDTARKMTQEYMAARYEMLYYKTAFKKDLVSVVIPTFNRSENLKIMLAAQSAQTYRPLEIVVADDNSDDATRSVTFEFASQHKDISVKYTNTHNEGYGLAQARNLGIFEASGHYIVFNDDRMIPAPPAIETLIKRLSSISKKSAVWGNKQAGKRDFMENFFAIRKRDIVFAGMFNERINKYGGQSQEVRERLRNQGFLLEYEPEAQATPSFGTRRNKRRYDIAKTKYQIWKLTQSSIFEAPKL